MATPADVRHFWTTEIGPAGWYRQDVKTDKMIRDRFEADWMEAWDGGKEDWRSNAEDMLAYLILTDQFPRNMFRGDARSFATDHLARRAAKCAVAKEWDQRIAPPERQFFFLPLMHSENLNDQDRAVRLFKARMPDGNDNLVHACAHREVIRRLGRFPFRNEALGRGYSPEEQAFMDDGGYGAIVRLLGEGER